MSGDLTAEEAKNVRAALHFLRVRCGSWKPVAKALRYSRATMQRASGPVLAFRVARLAGVSIDDVLTGKFPPAGTCPRCGARAGELGRHTQVTVFI